MAWIKSKKVFAILKSNEQGKEIIKDAPELTDDELENRIDDFFDNHHFEKPDSEGIKTSTSDNEVVEKGEFKFVIKTKVRDKLRKLFKWVFRKKDEEAFNDFFDALNDCSSEEKALFIQAVNKSIDNIYQGKGQGYFSPYERKIILDKKQLVEDGYYVKNGVAFHEFGHCIDWTIGNGIKGGSYASFSYVGEDGLTMEQALDEDVNNISWDDIQKDVDSEYNNDLAKQQELKNRHSEISEEIDKMNDYIRENKKRVFKEKYGEDFDKFKVDVDNMSDRDKEMVYFINNTFYSTDFINIIDNFPEVAKKYKSAKSEYSKIASQYSDISKKRVRDWGDVSDIYSGYNHSNLGKGHFGLNNVGMGHQPNYWKERKHNAIVMECFAEMYQGITVNLTSYAKMKKYFPKASKVFEEIISKFGKEVKEDDE